AGRIGTIDDRNGGESHTAGDADLLVALEERIVERAVRVHLTLKDRILDASAAQVEDLTLELPHTRPQCIFSGKRRAILRKERIGPSGCDLGLLLRDLPLQLGDLRAQADHVRMIRLHEGALLLIIRLELSELLLESERALRNVAGRTRRKCLPVGALGRYALRGSLGQGLVELNQRLPLQRAGVATVLLTPSGS